MRPTCLLALLAACGERKYGTTPPGGDDDDTTTDTPTTDTDVTDTGDTGTGSTLPLTITDPTWRLHDDVGALVYAGWTQDRSATVHVEYSFDDGVWLSTPSHSFGKGTHELLVAGIPYDTGAEWKVVADGGSEAAGDPIQTGPLPFGLPTGSVTVEDPARWLPTGNYLVTSINQRTGGWTGGDYWTFVIDRQGRVVWAHLAPDEAWTLFVQISVTGDHFLWDEQTYWRDFGEGLQSKVHRTYLDREIEIVDTPGLHHAFVELPDGTIAYGSQAHGGREALVTKAPAQADETVVWDCETDWPGSGFQCESNGLFYVEATDSFLYSFYTNDSVVEVDRATGTSLWWAGGVPNGYAFDPASSQFSWQHGISYTSTGSLLLSSEWDGGDGGPDSTYVMEYDVDALNRQLHLLWSDNSNVYATTNGQAWRLDNGNTLHIVGSAGVLREVEPGGDDVWRVDFDGTHLLGNGFFVEDLYTLVAPVE